MGFIIGGIYSEGGFTVEVAERFTCMAYATGYRDVGRILKNLDRVRQRCILVRALRYR